jgi:pimeloyl-ACP methyl ester carboxylesterase
MELKTIQTQRVPVRYYEGGAGRPLVFLHGAGGLEMDLGFLDSLAQKFHVYAPLVPGYGDSEECPELRDMLDFTLLTWDVVEQLGLKDPILAGFSMGGMIASEMAAIAPNDVSRLALIAPAGLWMDAHPIPDIFAMLPYQLPAYLFYDAEAGAKIMSAGTNMSDPKFLQAFLVQNARQLGAAGKILFPIPERGLASRLYRIKAKTMLIWGEGDKLIPPVYAQAFQRGIAGAEVVVIRQAGHVAPFEKPAEVIGAIARLQ